MSDAPADRGDGILETRLVAPAAPAPPTAPGLAVGAVLSRTMRAWWAHALAFSAMSLAVFAPLLAAGGLFFGWAMGVAEGRQPSPREIAWRAGAFLVAGAASLVLSVVQMGAVTYGTVRYLAGERAPPGRMIAVGLRRGLPVVGAWIVVWIVAVAGMLLFLVPGVMFLVAACVAVPAAVVERRGVASAIRRSFELTRGHRWTLLAAGLVVLVVMWLLSAAVQMSAMLVMAVLPPAHALAVTLLASQLGSALFSVLPVVAVAVCYHDLRLAKDGVDTAELARVFE
ncbi:MAG TPA: hypothetical protein VF841_19620 [Anaeromyxobacter sp.]